MNGDLVIVAWSGGVDSTALIGHLLKRGHRVIAYTLLFYGHNMNDRERKARSLLAPRLMEMSSHGASALICVEQEAEWIWNFSPDGVEIPRRNKHIIDYMMTKAQQQSTHFIGLGEYVGADTWAVKDHVEARDADARHLESYILAEYGLDYQLYTLRDFGASRYKHERVQLLAEVVDPNMTTNCMADTLLHCGECYKCVERACAFDVAGIKDETIYSTEPRADARYTVYKDQMAGLPVHIDWSP